MGYRRAVDIDRKAARHPDHRNGERSRRRRARLGTVASGQDRNAVTHCRATPSGAADTPRRTGADAQPADDCNRRSADNLAAGFVPAGHRRRRRSAGGAGIRTLHARQAHRRFVLWGRTVRAAACSKIAGFGVRQRCGRGSGVAEGGDIDARTETDQGRGTRSVPASADAAAAARLRYRRVRSAAAGRAGASRSARSLRPARFRRWLRCRATSRPLPATRGFWSTAATNSSG